MICFYVNTVLPEFHSLIEEHKAIYRMIARLRSTLSTVNKEEIIEEIRRFKQMLSNVVEFHFAAEEEIVLPLLPKKSEDPSSPVDCVMDEHVELIKKDNLFEEFLNKYDNNLLMFNTVNWLILQKLHIYVIQSR